MEENNNLPKITGYDILAHTERNIGRHYTLGVSEFGFYNDETNGRRIDAFFLDRHRKETMGIEIKVSRQDFLSDKKWREYLPYCSRFYFIAPVGIIKKEELPKDIGLIEVFWKQAMWKEDYSEEDMVQGVNYWLQDVIVKKCKKLHDLSPEVYVDILERLMTKMYYSKNLLRT